jgi:hypothetical protein
VTLKRVGESGPSQVVAGQPVGSHPANRSWFAFMFSIAEEDEMPLIFRPTSWMLATVVVGVMTHAAAAGSFTRGCAARDLQLLSVIEEQEKAGSIPAEKISDALLEMMHARIVCYQGQVLDALAIYDAVAESVRPIRSERAEIQ